MNVFHRAAEIAHHTISPFTSTADCVRAVDVDCKEVARKEVDTLVSILPPQFCRCDSRGHRVTFLLMLAAMRDAGDL